MVATMHKSLKQDVDGFYELFEKLDQEERKGLLYIMRGMTLFDEESSKNAKER